MAGAGRAGAVGREVRGDATTNVGDVPDHVPPQVGVDEDAVHEERRREEVASALVHIRDLAATQGDGLARQDRCDLL